MEGIMATLILLLVLSFIYNVCYDDINKRVLSCFCVIIFSITCTIILIDYISKDEPTALDVYQGKTTIEITYRDSIPVDSVVVFKEEFKK